MTNPQKNPQTNPFGAFPKPDIKLGQTLWLSDGQHLNTRRLNRYPVMVTHTFVGKDDRLHCLLEIEKEGVYTYKLVPAMALSSTRDGPDFMNLMLIHPQAAKQFLHEAGFIDDDGSLKPEYGGEF